MSPLTTVDFLIIGGGIIGVCIARELRRRYPKDSICVIEKEAALGRHASGRNSGVLHAGFYYTPDSLKARFTREGNSSLTAYCEKRRLLINKCGKLVVARNEAELSALDELLDRGRKNKVELYEVSFEKARELEPRARTYKRALFSPTTSSVNPLEVMCALRNDAISESIQIHTGVKFRRFDGSVILTNHGNYRANYVVNASGLYADRIARAFGFSKNYRILPFKGLYLYSTEKRGALRRHVYPVPNLQNPFLGVHFTVTAEGKTKIGPTAVPTFWREQYKGFQGFNFRDLAEISILFTSLMAKSSFHFRRLAMSELSKQRRGKMVRLASEMLDGIDIMDYKIWGKPGIRAQLLDLRTRRLEMDFVLEGDKRSMHVLNAVSPGFTCAIPFAKYVCDQIALT